MAGDASWADLTGKCSSDQFDFAVFGAIWKDFAIRLGVFVIGFCDVFLRYLDP